MSNAASPVLGLRYHPDRMFLKVIHVKQEIETGSKHKALYWFHALHSLQFNDLCISAVNTASWCRAGVSIVFSRVIYFTDVVFTTPVSHCTGLVDSAYQQQS